MLDATEVAGRIAELRKARSLTQDQLGDRVGVSAQAVSKWESGAAMPDLSLVPDICQALGVSSDTLLGVQRTTSDDDPLQRFVREMGQSRTPPDLRGIGEAMASLFSASIAANPIWPPDAELGSVRSLSAQQGVLIHYTGGMTFFVSRECLNRLYAMDTRKCVALLQTLADRETIGLLMQIPPGKLVPRDALGSSERLASSKLATTLLNLAKLGFVAPSRVGYSLSGRHSMAAVVFLAACFLYEAVHTEGVSASFSYPEGDHDESE